jgi:hypothetical protein
MLRVAASYSVKLKRRSDMVTSFHGSRRTLPAAKDDPELHAVGFKSAARCGFGCDSIRDAVEALTDRRSPLEKAAEMLEKMAALPAEELAKLSDREFELPFRLYEEHKSTFDMEAPDPPSTYRIPSTGRKSRERSSSAQFKRRAHFGPTFDSE